MRNFKNLAEFNTFLESVIAKEKLHMTAILDVMAQLVEDEAKRKFGIYQAAANGFEAWKTLAESTMAQRERLGYEPDNPLYRSGDLMHSIYHKVEGYVAATGSNEDIMVWQELGTNRIPPRAVLGPAAFESKLKLIKIAQEGLIAWLLNKAQIKRKP